jgi:uncharacterized membrane protein
MNAFLIDTAALDLAPLSRRRGECRQHGSVAVMAAIFLSIMVILLSSVDIGYMFYMKRNLQKAADLAALAGTQQLVGTPLAGNPTACAVTDAPVLAAIGNAQSNGFSILAPNPTANAITVTCGRWDPLANLAMAPNYFSVPVTGTNLNAVKVVLTQTVPAFFGLGTQSLSAQAIASSSDPYAAFSVGSNLLEINGGAVTGLLSAIGLNLNNTSVLSYKGLANVSVTPGGLLQALGFQIPLHASVGTITQILSVDTATGCTGGKCPLQTLLGAISTVGGQQNLISALGLTVAQLNVMIPLLTDPNDPSGRGGLFTLINAADGQSALNVTLNALNVVSTAVGVANGTRFGTLPGTGVNLPGIVNANIWAGVIEPPSIAIGGVGDGNTTKAFTSQVRLYAHIKSNLLNLNLINIDLPLIADVVNGQGTLKSMCTAADKDSSGNDRATIHVQAPLLSLCAGGINGATTALTDTPSVLSTVFSTSAACSQNLANYPMINVLGALTVNKSIVVNAFPNDSTVQLLKGQTLSTPMEGNSLWLGTTVTNLLSSLMGALAGGLLGNNNVNNSNLATNLLNGQTLAPAQNMVTSGLSNLSTLAANQNTGLLAGLGNLVGNLLTSVGQLVSNIFCLGDSQCILKNQLAGSQSNGGTTYSNAAIASSGLLVYLLQPILDGLGTFLSSALNDLLGVKLGLVDVTLLDLNCGGTSVKLVY